MFLPVSELQPWPQSDICAWLASIDKLMYKLWIPKSKKQTTQSLSHSITTRGVSNEILKNHSVDGHIIYRLTKPKSGAPDCNKLTIKEKENLFLFLFFIRNSKHDQLQACNCSACSFTIFFPVNKLYPISVTNFEITY